jgi:propanol-preferring alcohol dehydrogenase
MGLMKAWALEHQAPIGMKPLTKMNLEIPEPIKGEIRIKVVACGVCRTDIHIAEGDLPLKKSPLVLGHEIVGIVDKLGKGVTRFKPGVRVGVAWLHSACGTCKFCSSGRENLCQEAKFTGWDVNGGFAEYTMIHESFAFALGDALSFEALAPMMCPGIAGYRTYRLAQVSEGETLGLYGYGPTASYVLQVAHAKGVKVFVITRSGKNQQAAREMGADWVGDYTKMLPEKLDAAIIFPPAGELVEGALTNLERGGRLVLSPVTMTPITIKDYNHIWMERSIISLANISREDGDEFLEIAQKEKIKSRFETFGFDDLPEVMMWVKEGKIHGNAVIWID